MGTLAATNFNSFEIAQVGVASVSATAAVTNWSTVAHNLGYAPAPIAFLNNITLSPIFTSGNLPLPTFISVSVAGGVVQFTSYLFVSADATNVYFTLLNGTGSPISSFPIKYYLLRERAT